MSAILKSRPVGVEVEELHSGDRMDREEFHRRYEMTPRDFKAELIGGIVFVASPLRIAHGQEHLHLGMLFAAYEMNTPGVQASDNATIFLGKDSEPQPDLLLRVRPEYGGQTTTNRKGYVVGAPELVAEISHSTHAIDLHAKHDDYTRHGVREYLVATLSDNVLRWFDLSSRTELRANSDGVVRIRSFPGFWIDAKALFARDYRQLMTVLQAGLDSADHTAFVKQLAQSSKD